MVIPLFNKEKHILATLESVTSQHYPVSEIIVIDDGSTDCSADVVASSNINNLRLVRQNNQGVSAARNTGIKAARFPYVAFLDGDDQWLPFFTEEMAHLIQRYPDASAYTSRYQCVESGNKFVDPKIYLNDVDPYGMIMHNYFELASKGDLPFMMSSTLVKKDIFERIDGFPVGEKMGEDQDVFARIALHGYIAYCPNINLLYHRDTDNRACDNNVPYEECGFSKRLHEIVNCSTFDEKLRQDIIRYTAAHLCHLAKQNIRNQNPAVALKLLRDKRCFTKPKHLIALSLWASFQQVYLALIALLSGQKPKSNTQAI